MRSYRSAFLLIVGLGLTGCVGVNDGYGRQPYGGTYSGNSGFVTPYRYANPSSRYLYDQSNRSWYGNSYRPAPNTYRPRRYDGPGRANNPSRHNPPGHNNRPGRGNGRDRD